jgi:hypothetical protein
LTKYIIIVKIGLDFEVENQRFWKSKAKEARYEKDLRRHYDVLRHGHFCLYANQGNTAAIQYNHPNANNECLAILQWRTTRAGPVTGDL